MMRTRRALIVFLLAIILAPLGWQLAGPGGAAGRDPMAA